MRGKVRRIVGMCGKVRRIVSICGKVSSHREEGRSRSRAGSCICALVLSGQACRLVCQVRTCEVAVSRLVS